MIVFAFMKAVVFNSHTDDALLLYQSWGAFPLLKAKLSYLSSAAGHVDARCWLIKCLPLQLEFMQVPDIQGESETNSLIEFSLSLKNCYASAPDSYLNAAGCIDSAPFPDM